MECCVTAYHNIHQMKDIGTFTVVRKNSIYDVSISCNRMSQINLLTAVEVQDLCLVNTKQYHLHIACEMVSDFQRFRTIQG